MGGSSVVGSWAALPVSLLFYHTTYILPLIGCAKAFKCESKQTSLLWKMFLHLGTFLSNGTFLHFGYAIRNFTVNTLHNTTVTLSVSGSSSAMKQIPRNMILRERERERRARAHTHTHTLIFPEGRERLFTLNTYMTHMGVQDISPFRIPSSRQITTIKQHEYYSRRRRQQLLLLLLLTR